MKVGISSESHSNSEVEWREKFNAAETLAGQLRDRLIILRKTASSEQGKSEDETRADWWQSACERLDNGISEADRISDSLAVLDEGLPEISRL